MCVPSSCVPQSKVTTNYTYHWNEKLFWTWSRPGIGGGGGHAAANHSLIHDLLAFALSAVPMQHLSFQCPSKACLQCVSQVPWFALAVWTASGAAAGMGAWLLFAGGTSLHNLATNLPLVVSILWALAHHLAASMALWFALGLRRKNLAGVASVSEVCASAALSRKMPHSIYIVFCSGEGIGYGALR